MYSIELSQSHNVGALEHIWPRRRLEADWRLLQARYVQVRSLDNRVTSRYKKPCDEDAGDVEKDFAEKLFFCVLWWASCRYKNAEHEHVFRHLHERILEILCVELTRSRPTVIRVEEWPKHAERKRSNPKRHLKTSVAKTETRKVLQEDSWFASRHVDCAHIFR